MSAAPEDSKKGAIVDESMEIGDSSDTGNEEEHGQAAEINKTGADAGEGERPSKRARRKMNHYDIERDHNDNDDDSDFSTGDVPEPTEEGKAASATAVDPTLLQHAKSRLSKWAARLFDPDRPRGLVQAPETIPLNDEHLKAFGERVKQEQQAMSLSADAEKALEIKSAIYSDDDDDDDDALYEEIPGVATPKRKKKKAASSSKKSKEGFKVKISNMSYRTDTVLLRAACERYGPLLDVNLIVDKDNPSLNSGRAYVTFQLAEDAQECVDNLEELGGRKLRLALAAEKSKNASAQTPGGGGKAGGSKSLLNRFFDKDITTVCFRCGEVGHYESDCKNPAKPRPCALCGSLEHQDRRCDHKMICFNCGCPGHSARDCTERRGLPRRLVCGICFESGHHRNSCRNYRGSGAAASRDAVCMDCGQLGHFVCRELKWFFGLKGISCFNCGGQGHSGFQCTRPNVFQCRDEPQIAVKEIERAEAESVAEELQRQQQQEAQQSRGRQMGRTMGGGGGGNRHRSMPPQPNRGYSMGGPPPPPAAAQGGRASSVGGGGGGSRKNDKDSDRRNSSGGKNNQRPGKNNKKRGGGSR